MRSAMIYPEPQQGKKRTSFATNEVAASSVRKARAVLAASTSMAADVVNGSLSLDRAYAKVKQDAEDSKQLQWDRGRCKCGLPTLSPLAEATTPARTGRAPGLDASAPL